MITLRVQIMVGILLAVLLHCTLKAEAILIDAVEDTALLTERGKSRRPSRLAPSKKKRISDRLSQPSTISFAADNHAWLFINGHFIRSTHNPSQMQTVEYSLNDGDVIGIMAGSLQQWYGVIADVNFEGKHFVTGKNVWKARKGFSSVSRDQGDWRTRGYSSCYWSQAVVRPKTNEMFPGKARRFPYKHGAKYVWAQGASATDSVLLRLVVGGEGCSQPRRGFAKITLSAEKNAVLYVNGKRIIRVSSPSQVREAKAQLRKGDVISIVAEDDGSHIGAVVDVRTETNQYKTGQPGWKAVRLANLQDPRSWMMMWFDSCHWPDAVVCPFPENLSKKQARRFPFEQGAKYVSADGAGTKDKVALRFVVGGEECPSAPVLVRQRIAFDADKRDWIFVNGRYISLGDSHRMVLPCVHSRQIFGRCEALLMGA